MASKKQIYKPGMLEKIVKEENSCVSLVQSERKLALLPIYQNDIKSGVLDLLYRSLKKFDRNLSGILMGYKNVKILLDNRNTGKITGRCGEFEVNVKLEFYIFQPRIGSYLEGVVNKKSMTHIGCLVHRYFNATILKPDHIEYEDWSCNNVDVGDKITFKVVDLDFSGALPFIEGFVENDFVVTKKAEDMDFAKSICGDSINIEEVEDVDVSQNAEKLLEDNNNSNSSKRLEKTKNSRKRNADAIWNSTQRPSIIENDLKDVDFNFLSPVVPSSSSDKKKKKKRDKDKDENDDDLMITSTQRPSEATNESIEFDCLSPIETVDGSLKHKKKKKKKEKDKERDRSEEAKKLVKALEFSTLDVEKNKKHKKKKKDDKKEKEREKEERLRLEKEREEKLRLEKEIQEQLKLEKEMEEKLRIEKKIEKKLKLEKIKEEKLKLEKIEKKLKLEKEIEKLRLEEEAKKKLELEKEAKKKLKEMKKKLKLEKKLEEERRKENELKLAEETEERKKKKKKKKEKEKELDVAKEIENLIKEKEKESNSKNKDKKNKSKEIENLIVKEQESSSKKKDKKNKSKEIEKSKKEKLGETSAVSPEKKKKKEKIDPIEKLLEQEMRKYKRKNSSNSSDEDIIPPTHYLLDNLNLGGKSQEKKSKKEKSLNLDNFKMPSKKRQASSSEPEAPPAKKPKSEPVNSFKHKLELVNHKSSKKKPDRSIFSDSDSNQSKLIEDLLNETKSSIKEKRKKSKDETDNILDKMLGDVKKSMLGESKSKKDGKSLPSEATSAKKEKAKPVLNGRLPDVKKELFSEEESHSGKKKKKKSKEKLEHGERMSSIDSGFNSLTGKAGATEQPFSIEHLLSMAKQDIKFKSRDKRKDKNISI